jgi:6-phosphogluconolactonase (cycloisomerase 2 family)
MDADGPRVHVGCYTKNGPPGPAGIVSFALDGEGLLHGDPIVTETANPSFLAVTDGLLYATHETAAGRVSSYRRLAGELALSASTATGGDGPAHVAISADGHRLVVVNYAAGNVAAIQADGHGGLGEPAMWYATGSGPHPQRQQRPHPHQSMQLPNGNWLVADLGADVIAELSVSPGAAPACVARYPLPPGSGPRNLVCLDSWLYVAGELDSRVHGLHWQDGAYRWQWSLPSFDPARTIVCTTNDPSHIHLAADRHHLYLANRGRDTIGVFAVAPAVDGGGLTLVQERPTEGEWPRHFAVAGDRLYVANQRSNRVCVFALDSGSGLIGDLLQTVEVTEPACVVIA